jgi:hypothetical protein
MTRNDAARGGDGYVCDRCEGTEPEEVTGGWRCARCQYQPAECTCYEVIGGHQPGCAFARRDTPQPGREAR